MTIEQRRNLVYQQRLSLQVTQQMNALMSLLSKGLNVHLNLGQQFNMNTPAVLVSMETLSAQALAEKEIQFASNARIRLPATFNGTDRTSLRVRLFPIHWDVFLDSHSLVHTRTIGFVWSVEQQPFPIDLLDSPRWRWQ